MSDDWRLLRGQNQYLSNTYLIYQKYKPKNPTNDHDHCEFCMVKFGYQEGSLNEGYSTLDNDIWICPQCYMDFRRLFNWKLLVKQEK